MPALRIIRNVDFKFAFGKSIAVLGKSGAVSAHRMHAHAHQHFAGSVIRQIFLYPLPGSRVAPTRTPTY